MLALAGHDARQWEPKTLRHRLFTIAATLARTTRQRLLHIKPTAPRADLFTPHGPCLAALAHTLTSEPVPSNPAPPRPWKTTPTGSDIPANAAPPYERSGLDLQQPPARFLLTGRFHSTKMPVVGLQEVCRTSR